MKVHTLWIQRKDFNTPELVAAWDEFCIEENESGWKEECDDALRAIGSDLGASRYITLDVPEGPLFDAFDEPEVPVTVSSTS
jgi:hypothetical protein